MIERLSANTATLQKQFPSVYRDFFAKSQRVASASNAFLWTGEFAGFYGGLTVSQKLPIRSYVGFETTFDKAVTISKEYATFDAEHQQFVTGIADDRLCHNMQHYLESYFQNDKDFTGIQVHLLTEIPLGHSLGLTELLRLPLRYCLSGTRIVKRPLLLRVNSWRKVRPVTLRG